MAAALVVTLGIALVALASLAGAPESRVGLGRVFALGLPVFVISGAAILPVGAVWWSALLMATATAVGIVLAAKVGPRLDSATVDRPALASAVAVGRSLVVVVLAAVAVRWLAPIIASFTNLDALAVAVVVIAAAVAAAVLARGRFGLGRTALIISAAVAILMLVAGIVLGTPGRMLDPVVPVAGPDALALVVSLLAAVAASAVHPGLAALAKEEPSSAMRGAVVTAAVGAAGLLGLILLAGGSVDFPSNALVTLTGYIAFAPSLVGATLAGLVALVLTVVVAASLDATLAPWTSAEDLTPSGWLAHRWVALLAAGLGVYLITAVGVSGGWLLGTAGVAAVLVLVARSRTRAAVAQL